VLRHVSGRVFLDRISKRCIRGPRIKDHGNVVGLPANEFITDGSHDVHLVLITGQRGQETGSETEKKRIGYFKAIALPAKDQTTRLEPVKLTSQ
jgi:hypothetical protein